jgi:hypothetical protein
LSTVSSVAVASNDLRASDAGGAEEGGQFLSSLDCRNNSHLPISSDSFILEVNTLDRAGARDYHSKPEEHTGLRNFNIQPSCFGPNMKCADLKLSKPRIMLKYSELLERARARGIRMRVRSKLEIQPDIQKPRTQENQFSKMSDTYDSGIESDKMDPEMNSDMSSSQCSRTDEVASVDSSWDRGSDIETSLERKTPTLDTMRKFLVESMMAEFWVIFDQDWTSSLSSHTHTPGNSSPNASTEGGQLTNSSKSIQLSSLKTKNHLNNAEDDQGEDDDDENFPKRPKKIEHPEHQIHHGFSCPFRKQNSQKYNINDWKILCFDFLQKHRASEVSIVCCVRFARQLIRDREHLYRRHLIGIQCTRCWNLFRPRTC